LKQLLIDDQLLTHRLIIPHPQRIPGESMSETFLQPSVIYVVEYTAGNHLSL